MKRSPSDGGVSAKDGKKISGGGAAGNGGRAVAYSSGTRERIMISGAERREPLYYYANIVGYIRIILGFYAVLVFRTRHLSAALAYAASQLMDALDGHLARHYQQSSIFGAALDMMTDRLSTLGIYLMLAAEFPSHAGLVFLLSIFDVGGHWIYLQAQTLGGAESHKRVPVNWAWLKFYYENRHVMFVCHLSHEVALCAALIRWPAVLILSFPLALYKVATNAAQILVGCRIMLEMDAERRRQKSPVDALTR